jgi:sulfur carrier protein
MNTPVPATVTANGQEVALPAPCNLEAFLTSQGLPPRTVVVELNGEAIPPSEFVSTTIHPGDRIEMVRIVAGG